MEDTRTTRTCRCGTLVVTTDNNPMWVCWKCKAKTQDRREYYKAWKKANRLRYNKYQREYGKRMRDIARSVLNKNTSDKASVLNKNTPVINKNTKGGFNSPLR